MRGPLKSTLFFRTHLCEKPKVLKQRSVICDLQFRTGSVLDMFFSLRFLAFKCLTPRSGSILHVVCKKKYCVAMVHVPVLAELQKLPC